MNYEFKNNKIITKSIEYSVSYHCNLRCSACTHLSPFQKINFPALESFAADINQLGKGLHAKILRLLGGEPLLNPEINSFVKTAKASGLADRVMVTTNGLILHKMADEFWENIDLVLVSSYPGIIPPADSKILQARAQKHGTELWVQPLKQFRTTFVTEPHPRDWLTKQIFMTCKDVHEYHCHMIHEGLLYKCAAPPFLPAYLARLGIDDYEPAKDGFNIHGVADVFTGVRDFLLSTAVMEACRYCLGFLGKVQNHHQLSSKFLAEPALLNISRDHHLNRNKLIDDLLASSEK